MMRHKQCYPADIMSGLVLPSNSIEDNERMVNRIELRHLSSGGNFSLTEIQELRSLAVSCPFTEGTAVYRARNLLVEVDSFNTEYINDCELPSGQGSKSMSPIAEEFEEIPPQFVLYPNPNAGSVFVSVINPAPEEQYFLDIYNMLGQCVKSIPISTRVQDYQISLENLENSLYLYTIVRLNYEIIHYGQ